LERAWLTWFLYLKMSALSSTISFTTALSTTFLTRVANLSVL